jgi:tRNA threonylcarbamoyladenosine biosynthesis protein TsaE
VQRQLDIVSNSAEQTCDLARTLALHFREPNLVVLTGPLGAGKTIFVKGLARALHIDEAHVSSPSFTMVNEYSGERPIFHFDLFRLNHISELRELGWDDYLQREGLIVVEWGERAAEALPAKYYVIRFDIVGEQQRHITVSLEDRP